MKNYTDSIIGNKNIDISTINLKNNYFYLTPKGIIFNWVLDYKDNIVDEYIDYSSLFVESKEIEDIISHKYKNIFD